MNKAEIKRFGRLVKLADELRITARATLEIKIGDEKTMDKAKAKCATIIENMTDV